MKQQRLRFVLLVLALLACLLITAIYIYPEYKRFVTGSQLEFSDFANNALRIRDAIQLHEIYGNFSRYGFYHPGPAFWYLYGAGELVFYRWTGLVSSAPFAHILVGTIFQAICAIVAILYLSYRTRWIIAPFLLAILLLHWHFMLGAPSSIWPPHVLFGPFLLLLVFGAGVAAGDARCIPLLAFACGMLVHGHVAQPIQVFPVALFAIGGYITNRQSQAPQIEARYCVMALIIVVLFVMPLILDLRRGPQSNVAAILAHLRSSSAGRHTLKQGLSYFLSFFRYEIDQDVFIGDPHFSLALYLRHYWLSWVIGVISFGCGQIVLLSRRFLIYPRLFVALVDLSIILSIFWGAFQDGPMYDFNGNYFYAVVYMVYSLPLVLVACTTLVPSSRLAVVVAATAGIVALLGVVPVAAKPLFTMAIPADALDLELLTVTQGASRVYVKIPRDRWITGFGVVLALDRLGVDFRVDREYAFLYGERDLRSKDAKKELGLLVSPIPCDQGIRIPDFGYGSSFVCATEDVSSLSQPLARVPSGDASTEADEDSVATTACDGNIDRVNGTSPVPSVIHSSGTLQVDGWLAASVKAGAAADDVFVVLTDPNGRRHYVKAKQFARNDVNAYFGQPKMGSVGFEISIDVSQLAGHYLLGLAGRYNGRRFRCEQFHYDLEAQNHD